MATAPPLPRGLQQHWYERRRFRGLNLCVTSKTWVKVSRTVPKYGVKVPRKASGISNPLSSQRCSASREFCSSSSWVAIKSSGDQSRSVRSNGYQTGQVEISAMGGEHKPGALASTMSAHTLLASRSREAKLNSPQA